jgi:N-acetylneuraminic acid mutarotase
MDANNAAEGVYDFQFRLYEDPSDANKVGSDVDVADVDVIDGYFTVLLDFGSSVFDGDARWLEIGVRPGELDDPNVYTVLSPRQEVTPTPRAIYAKTADSDGDWTISDGNMYSAVSGNVGIGTTSPDNKLEVSGRSILFSLDEFHTGFSVRALDTTIFRVDTDAYESYFESGNVGIGTTSPGSTLEVVGNVEAQGFTIGGVPVGSSSGTYWSESTGNIYYNSGNVGIGTTSPSSKLYVRSSAPAVAGWFETTKSNGNTNALEVVADADNTGDNRGLYILTMNNGAGKAYSIYSPRTAATMYHEGSVGIGTIAPEGKLHVVGDVPRGVVVKGETLDVQGKGVYGYASATSGVNYGVYGKTESAAGYAGGFAGNIKISGTGNGIEFPDGTVQTTAAEPSGFCFFGDSPTPPVGYTFTGSVLVSETGGAWCNKASMPEPGRTSLAAAAVNGKIYAIGGVDNVSLSRVTYEYDPVTNIWTSKADMPAPGRVYLAAAAVNGKIYAIGGFNGNHVRDTDEYDPVTNIWTSKADMPAPGREALAVAAVNGKIYAIGGSNGNYLRDTDEYDPVTNIWTSKADMPEPGRTSLAAAAVNGKIYAIGGYNDDPPGTLRDTDEYDPATNTWTPRCNMLSPPRWRLAAAAVDSKIYAIGGQAETGSADPLRDTDEYDPATDNWTPRSDMPSPARDSLAAAAVNGKIYVIGGYDGDTKLRDIAEYTPIVECTPPTYFYLHKKD